MAEDGAMMAGEGEPDNGPPKNGPRPLTKEDIERTRKELADLAEEVGLEKKRAELLLRQGGVVSIDQPDEDGLSVGDRLPSDLVEPDEKAYRAEAKANGQVYKRPAVAAAATAADEDEAAKADGAAPPPKTPKTKKAAKGKRQREEE